MTRDAEGEVEVCVEAAQGVRVAVMDAAEPMRAEIGNRSVSERSGERAMHRPTINAVSGLRSNELSSL